MIIYFIKSSIGTDFSTVEIILNLVKTLSLLFLPPSPLWLAYSQAMGANAIKVASSLVDAALRWFKMGNTHFFSFFPSHRFWFSS